MRFGSFVVRIGLAIICLPSWTSIAHAEWWEAETAHFVVKSKASEAETRAYAIELEQFDRVLRSLQGMPIEEADIGRANKPTIYRFGHANDLAKIYGAPGSGVAGFFISRAGGSVGFAPTDSDRQTTRRAAESVVDSRTELSPRTVLFHEYTHYFMMQHFPGAYPRWYVEGFAELMATTRIESGKAHVGDPPQHRAYQIFQLSDFPLEKMLDPAYKLSGTDGLQHYATGWLLTHYLSFDPELREKLRAYLKALAREEPGLETAKRYLGDLKPLESELRRYKRGPFPGFDISMSVAAPKIALRKLAPDEEGVMQQEMRLARGPLSRADAKDLVSDLERSSAGGGGGANALLLLGQAQLAANEFVDAAKSGAAATDADPRNPAAWLIRSEAALGGSSSEPAKATDARLYATEAAKLDRNDPRPLIAYYRSYVAAGETPDATAVTALETAYPRSGSDSNYRLLLTHSLLVREKLPLARRILRPVAFRGHMTAEPKDSKDPSLQRLLRLVEDGKRDESLAMATEMMMDDSFNDE